MHVETPVGKHNSRSGPTYLFRQSKDSVGSRLPLFISNVTNIGQKRYVLLAKLGSACVRVCDGICSNSG